MIDIRQDVGRKKTSIYRTLYYMPYNQEYAIKWSKKNKFSKKIRPAWRGTHYVRRSVIHRLFLHREVVVISFAYHTYSQSRRRYHQAW